MASSARVMRQATRKAGVGSDDRLALTVVLAIVLHAMVVLGVRFAPEPHAPSRFESMEVILVAERSEQAVKDAKLLAQANLVGGGDSPDDVRPSAPVKAPLPASIAVIANTPPPMARTQASPPIEQPAPAHNRDGRVSFKDRLTHVAERGELPLAARSHTRPTHVRPDAPPKPQPEPQPRQEHQTLPLGAQQLVHSFALANLAAELQEKLESHAKQPRRKYISAATKEYLYAAYMEAFRAKVERVGNLNYPEEARRRQIYGEVMLDVALNRAGNVVAVNVRRTSGKTVLDDVAIRIVGLAAPYDPLPVAIRKEVDELHITRIWRFDKRGEIAASR